MDYQQKYMKYKIKYIELKKQLEGGLIHRIPKNRLVEDKQTLSVPQKIKDYVKMITIPNTKTVRVGSSVLKIQPYFSDVDIMNVVELPMDTEELITHFIKNLKSIVTNLINRKDRFFSDFKAAGMHWKPEEIMAEMKDGKSLRDSVKFKDVLKIDMIVPYNERYLEMSTFFVLKSKQGYINVEDDYFASFKKSLLHDIEKYKVSKPFKAVKRVWSYARISNDLNTLDMLKDLITSNIAIIAQINADIETIELLIEHNSDYDLPFTINEINLFKERLSNMLDIDFDEEKVDLMIDKLIYLFTNTNRSEEKNKEKLEALGQLHDYLLTVSNKETLDYIQHIGFVFPKNEDSKKDSKKEIKKGTTEGSKESKEDNNKPALSTLI
jgi:hypothetical protein